MVVSQKSGANGASLVKFDYDTNENLVSEQDGNKNTKMITYDVLRRINKVSHYDAQNKLVAEKRVSYDEAYYDKFDHSFLKITVTDKGDESDRTSTYYYDILGRLAELSRFDGLKEESGYFVYDYLGNQISSSDFSGAKTVNAFNALGQITETKDAEGGTIEFTYDRLGNPLSRTDAAGCTKYMKYDSLGRKTLEKVPFDTNQYSVTKLYYDGTNNLIKIVDPQGYVTKNHYNSRNLLVAVENAIQSNQSNITKIEYDAEGNKTKISKGLNSWNDPDFTTNTYKYDKLNRLMVSVDASGNENTYEYDNNGNLVRATDRNNITTVYTYDALNRLTGKRNSKDGDKNSIRYIYDLLGNKKTMNDASGTTVYDYDLLGRLTDINYGNGIKQTYTYDSTDKITSLAVNQGSPEEIYLTYSYDKAGRLAKINDKGISYDYQYGPAGKLTSETNGVTGIRSEYQYYPSEYIKSLRHFSGDEVIGTYEYEYDLRGNQIEKREGYHVFVIPLSGQS